MRYMGSKGALVDQLTPVITTLLHRYYGLNYVEPFMGGCNMLQHIHPPGGRRIAGDINPYLVAMWQAIQKGWRPPTTISKDQYAQIRNNKDQYEPWLVAFVGFCCSFGGKWFAGYASDSAGTNYAAQGSRVLLQQGRDLRGVEFHHASYQELIIPHRSIIYCDPPYEGTTQYLANEPVFDHAAFWQWCREQTLAGNKVYISEYNAPEDFTCLKVINHTTQMDRNTTRGKADPLTVIGRTEKIFTFKAA